METEIFRLNLVSPLYFTPEDSLDPFDPEGGAASGGEKLFCFELDEAQYQSFEPDKNELLGTPVFRGIAAQAAPGEARTSVPRRVGEGSVELPLGHYLFAQKRQRLNREEIIAMAVEIQQEGLWQRLLPGKRIYLRYLFEDGREVTQLFRPYTE